MHGARAGGHEVQVLREGALVTTPEEEFAESLRFAIESIKLAIFRLQSQIERLENAFLRTHPATVLPQIPHTAEEVEFMEKYADQIGED